MCDDQAVRPSFLPVSSTCVERAISHHYQEPHILERSEILKHALC